MINDLDVVALARPVPEHRLEAGDVSTVVMVHDGGKGFTVEFTPSTGKTIAIVTLVADAIRPVAELEVAHVRHVA